MHNIKNKKHHEILKEEVEQSFGRIIKYSKDCKLLSSKVFDVTNRQLSISTVKRFFAVVQSPFNPSKYTLDTFSKYLGFDNWSMYINTKKLDVPMTSVNDDWEDFNKNAHAITESSIISLSARVRYNKHKFVTRRFAEEQFEGFIHSGKTVTMLVAPKGYGKSAVLLQWYNIHYSGNDKRFINDIIFLIDGGIFLALLVEKPNNEVLNQLLMFEINKARKFFISKERGHHSGRFFLIIDDVDKVFNAREKYYQLVDNLMQLIVINKDNNWFKIILTCRPENLDPFTSFVLQNPLLTESFYNTSFKYKNTFEAINVPLLTRMELQKAFSNYGIIDTYYHLSLFYPDTFNIISIPSFLSFFFQENYSSTANFSEIGFLNHLIQHFIYSHPFAEGKQLLIKKFLQLCDADAGITSVRKEELLESDECRFACQELIKAGIIYEYIDTSESPDIFFKVRFANSVIFDYLLARTLMSNRSNGIAIINRVFTKYKNFISIQYNLLKWFVKIIFYEKNIDLLKLVHQYLEGKVNVSGEMAGESMPGSLRTIHDAFVECFRIHKDIRELLMPFFAKDRLGQKLYFEEYFDMDNLMYFPESSLEVYIRNYHPVDGEMNVHYIRFIKGFYSLDYLACSREFEKIKNINVSELGNSWYAGYYFSSYFLYASLFENDRNEEMLKKVISYSDKLKLKSLSTFRFVPPFEFFIVYNLNTCNFFNEIIILAKYLETTRSFVQIKNSWFYQFFNLCHARALLHTGDKIGRAHV